MIGGGACSLGGNPKLVIAFFLDTVSLNGWRGRGGRAATLRLSPVSPRLKRIQNDAACCHGDGLHREPVMESVSARAEAFDGGR